MRYKILSKKNTVLYLVQERVLEILCTGINYIHGHIITVFTIQYLNLWSGQCFNKYNLLYMYYKLLNIALQRT